MPRRGRSAVVAAAIVALGLAFTPLPTHGGFVFLLPELVREGLREWRSAREARSERVREEKLDRRFAGYLPEGAIGDAWRDPASGLVWSAAVGTADAIDAAALAAAQATCAAREPVGYWALPRNAEFYYLWRTSREGGLWLADAYQWPEAISIPSRVRSGPHHAAGTGSVQAGGRVRTGVRCVAVTEPAPVRGYRSTDIALEDWNRYQLGIEP